MLPASLPISLLSSNLVAGFTSHSPFAFLCTLHSIFPSCHVGDVVHTALQCSNQYQTAFHICQ